MSAARIVYHLARADFYERIRRYSFLIMLGLAAFLGYQVAIGNITVRLDDYRGEFNSAWVGSMMSLISTFFIGWFGFYLVKGSIARDRDTGVGQIMATTPLTRPLYTIGKWASNFSVLTSMVAVLALASIPIQLLAGESTTIDLAALLKPFVFIALPVMALVSAIAVLFETIPFLQGGFGNITYFFLFILGLPISDSLSKNNPAFEPLGMGLLMKSMGDAAGSQFSEYGGGFVLGDPGNIIGVFKWAGVDWTANIVLTRLGFFGIAILLTLIAALFFDRFDPSKRKPLRRKTDVSTLDPLPAAPSKAVSTPQLTPLNTAANRFSFLNVLIAELKLMLKGQRWWWYLVAMGMIIACYANDSTSTRQIILPVTLLWPVLIWSSLGNRESQHNVQQLTFSSASPLWRQLPAQFLAGFIVTLLMSSGAALRFFSDGDMSALFSLLAGALFIPALALTLGVWTGTSKAFEIIYVSLWYIGPLNQEPGVDFLNSSGQAHPINFALAALLLIAFATYGRMTQINR